VTWHRKSPANVSRHVEPDYRVARQCGTDETLFGLLGLGCNGNGGNTFAGRDRRCSVAEIALAGAGLRRSCEMHRDNPHRAAQYGGQQHRQRDGLAGLVSERKFGEKLDQ
jgi:hypothetical protein